MERNTMELYELVGHNEEEMYFTIGLFTSMADAEAFILHHDGPRDTGNGGPIINDLGRNYFGDEEEVFCIYKREVNKPDPLNMGEKVATFRRDWDWSEDESEEVWTTVRSVALC